MAETSNPSWTEEQRALHFQRVEMFRSLLLTYTNSDRGQIAIQTHISNIQQAAIFNNRTPEETATNVEQQLAWFLTQITEGLICG